MNGRRRNRRNRAEVKSIEEDARARGLTLRVVSFLNMCGEWARLWTFEVPHLGRVLEYWPGTGTWRTEDGRRGVVNTHREALALAVELFERRAA